MPIHRFQTADGKIHRVEAPDRASAEAELQRVLSRPPSALKDAAKSFPAGVLEAAAGIADMVTQHGPVGVMRNTVQSAATLAGGERPSGMPNMFSAASDLAASVTHKPQTGWGEAARTLGQNTLNFFVPGSWGQRAANVVVPTLTTEAAGRTARAMGADKRGEGIARTVGGVVGAGMASVRPPSPGVLNPFRSVDPVDAIATRTRQNPVDMRARAADYRAAGISPALVDVVDDAGRGMIRAAANRQTPARQAANDFAEQRVENMPSRMSAQARRNMSRDPRTPDQIREREAANRSANANRRFGAVRGDQVRMTPETVSALRTDYGRQAITEAARRERDPEIRAALLRLANDALDNPATPITVGMADRISRTLLGRSQEAARSGDNDLAATLGSLGRAVREPAAAASPGYRAALEGYAVDSRLTEAARTGEQFMARNTDEFVRTAGRMSPRERAIAAAAGRRAVERASGENPSTAAGVARRIAAAPEQRARTEALVGPARARRLEQGMRMEARAVQNARSVQPSAGSSTFLNAADNNALSEAAGMGAAAIQGRWGAVASRAVGLWKSRGVSDQDAERLVRVAIDPSQTDATIAAIAQRLDPQSRRQLYDLRNAALIGATASATTLPAP